MNDWIKVGEELPPPDEVVWVYDKKPSKDYGYDVHTAKREMKNGDWRWVAGDDADTDPYDIEPTHWTAFVRPEPPKE